MSNESKKIEKIEEKAKEVAPAKKTDTIIIGGKLITIEKMKAGKYFQCQKVFLDMIKEVHSLNSQIELSNSKTPEERKKEGIKEVTFWDIMDVAPQKMMDFIASCIEVDAAFIRTEATPEEIPEAYAKIVSLNDFMGNIKNFVAPIRESLGV